VPRTRDRYAKTYKDSDWRSRVGLAGRYQFGRTEDCIAGCIILHPKARPTISDSAFDEVNAPVGAGNSRAEPATDEERARFRNVAARRIKLPLWAYNKLLRIVREAKLGE